MTDNLRESATGRSIALDAPSVEAPQKTLERLSVEVAKLRASRERLVLSGDAERREIERELHQGVQQHLVALAVNLQLASELAETDRPAAQALLQAMGRDVQQALDETTRLAQRIHAPLLEAGGLAAALRSAAMSAGIRASVEVAAGASYPPEVVRTVYLCCLDALSRAGTQVGATIAVREKDNALTFDVVDDGTRSAGAPARSSAGLDVLRDRVEALGGWLTIASEPGGGNRLSGSLPLSR
jgi:signal transduction histidine kinase